MGVEVFAADEQGPGHPVDTLSLIKLAEQVLHAEGVRGDAELSILFVDEQSIADLNKRFAGKDAPTDVLSFPIDEDEAVAGPRELGDVVICPEHTQDLVEAVVHGVLHLAGYDHETDDGQMLALQDRVMESLAE